MSYKTKAIIFVLLHKCITSVVVKVLLFCFFCFVLFCFVVVVFFVVVVVCILVLRFYFS